jgi:hypothetical protein
LSIKLILYHQTPPNPHPHPSHSGRGFFFIPHFCSPAIPHFRIPHSRTSALPRMERAFRQAQRPVGSCRPIAKSPSRPVAKSSSWNGRFDKLNDRMVPVALSLSRTVAPSSPRPVAQCSLIYIFSHQHTIHLPHLPVFN